MNDSSYLLTAIKVWAAAAWADGVIAPAEATTMRALIAAARLTDNQREVARMWLDQKVSLDDVAVDKIPANERLHIFTVACGVATMDQDVAATERGFLDRLATALGLSADDAKQARAAAGL